MKLKLLGSIGLFLNLTLHAALPMVSPEEVGMSSVKLEKVSEIVEALIEEKQMAGASVVVARQGKVCYFETFGQMDLKRNKPMSKDTIFRIYSFTKAITSTAIMQLYERGLIELDVPVKNYIPEFRNLTYYEDGKIIPVKTDLTISHLLTHTSGLVRKAKGDYGKLLEEANAYNKEYPLKRMIEKVAKTPLAFDPGSDWAYGTSIDVLGYLVEIISKQSLDEYFHKHIFKPLGMGDTGFYVPAEKVERFAARYKLNAGKGLKLDEDPQESPYLKKPVYLSGGGGLVSTSSDYMSFLLCIQSGGSWNGFQILKPETVKMMLQNHTPNRAGWVKFGSQIRDGITYNYGFSLCIEPSTFAPDRKVGDYGWGGMASTHYWISPEDQLVVVTMEQTLPFSFLLETAIKSTISKAIVKK